MKATILVLALLLIASVGAEQMTCQDAIASSMLSATINGSTATIENNAGMPFQISVASYQMYAALIEDQTLFASKTITVEDQANITIELPQCAHQVDVVCGEPLPYTPLYDALVIAHQFNTTNQYCTPRERDTNANVTVRIQDNYPKSTSYVFECSADGFTPTSYYWYYGDGEILPASNHSDSYHIYDAGNYTVACTATDGNTWQTGTIDIQVTQPTVSVTIAPWYPKESNYVFLCEAHGFNPTAFDWEFQDGEKLYDQSVADVYHTFRKNGQFQVTCAASDEERYITGSTTVNIENCHDYHLAIEDITQTDQGTRVTGSLTSDHEVSGETVLVNNIETGVLLGSWSTTINSTDNVSATFVSECKDEYTVTQQTEEPQEQTIVVTQQIHNSNGRNSCWPGFHKEDGKCVQDTPLLLAQQGEIEPQQNVVQETSEPIIEKQEYTGEQIQPTPKEAKSLAWLLIAIGLMALAFGIAIR